MIQSPDRSTDTVRRIATLWIVGLLVIGTVPPTVAAANPPDDRLPLTSYEKLEDVEVEGSQYAVYEYSSPLPYVGGIEVYQNGQPVQQESKAKAVVTAYARQEAVARLTGQELKVIRKITDDSKRIDSVTAAAIQQINQTIALRAALESRTINGTSAWKRATETSEALNRVFLTPGYQEQTEIEKLRNALIKYRQAAQNLNENASVVVDLVQQRQRGETIDKTQLFVHYQDMLTSLERVRSLSTELETGLSKQAKNAKRVTNQVTAVPAVGDRIADRFTTLRETLVTTVDEINRIEEAISFRKSGLQQVDRRAERIKTRLIDRLTSREISRAKVYGTGIELIVLIAAGVLTIGGRRP
ncbi:MAG: hypothetical protein ABEH65_09220 [Halobacteriales archaeon]